MKKLVLGAISIILISVLLVACGSVKDIDPDTVIDEIRAEYKLDQGDLYTSSSTTPGEFLDTDLIISYYGDAVSSPDFSKVEKYCVYLDDTNPRTITDVGIFKLKDSEYGETFMKYLQTRIDAKIADGKAYPDVDVATLQKSIVKQEGSYVYYIAAKEQEKINEHILEAFGK